MIVTVKLSIFAAFKQRGHLGYAHTLNKITVDLTRDDDMGARISVNIGAFIETFIDSKKGREDRELVSLSHSLLLVPS